VTKVKGHLLHKLFSRHTDTQTHTPCWLL